jgi:hypothetical protein
MIFLRTSNGALARLSELGKTGYCNVAAMSFILVNSKAIDRLIDRSGESVCPGISVIAVASLHY